MSDWVHCHYCYRKPSAQVKAFFITNCEVILCPICKEKLSKSNCLKCKKECAYYEINRNLPPHLLILFRDPIDYAKEAIKELQQLLAYQNVQKKSHEKAILMKWQKTGNSVAMLTKKQRASSTAESGKLAETLKENEVLKQEIEKLAKLEVELKKDIAERRRRSSDCGLFIKKSIETDSGLGSDCSFTFITSTPKTTIIGREDENLWPQSTAFFRDGRIISPIGDKSLC